MITPRMEVKNGSRVLIVDDEESILSSLSEVLQLSEKNLTIDTVGSAEEAISFFEKNEVDIVVTDLKLPKMSGLELLENVQMISPKTTSILMTAYGNSEVKELAEDSGCLAYLEKPFEIDHLISHIVEALNPQPNIHAHLRKFSLADIVHLHDLNKQSEVLQIISSRGKGLISIKEGKIIQAELGKLQGTEALVSMLELKDLVISSSNKKLPGNYSMVVNWEQLNKLTKLSDKEERLSFLNGPKPKNERLNELPKDPTPPHGKFLQELGDNLSVSPAKTAPEAAPVNNPQDIYRAPTPPPVSPTREIRDFIVEGIEHFKNERYEQAKQCWSLALRFNPECHEARKYLRTLETLLECE